MPFFSPADGAITLRIVYDGLGTAGKTTNIQKLHELYTLRRQGPVVTPEVVRGRTAYFDWLELSTGTLDEKYPLRCQVLTVPGQFAYAPRRWKLLKAPDAIVCVCDSTPAGAKRGRLGLEFLRKLQERGVCPDVPIVIQANKRDLPEAMPLEDLRVTLGLGAEERIYESIASSGEGVQLAFFAALDRARQQLRRHLDEHGTAGLQPPQAPEELLELLRVELDDAEDEAYAVADAITSEEH